MAPLRILALATATAAFVLPAPKPSTILRSQVEDKVDKTGDGTMLYNAKGPTNTAKPDDEEGLPWWWDGFWRCRSPRAASRARSLLGDTMRIFKSNIEQIYGDAPSADGAPLAEGDISGLADGALYLGLHGTRDGSARPTLVLRAQVIYRAVRRFTGTLCTSHEQQGLQQGRLGGNPRRYYGKRPDSRGPGDLDFQKTRNRAGLPQAMVGADDQHVRR